MNKKIATCKIEAGRWSNSVYVTYDDGSEAKLFEYYPDEISFDDTELVGLTPEQAYELKRSKDIAYIRS